MNFEVTREFYCFRQTIKQIALLQANMNCMVKSVHTEAIRQTQQACDFTPSWQNNIESIERGYSELTCLGAFLDGKMVGHCVFDVHTGDLTQIAVWEEYRRRGIGSRLLQEATKLMKTDSIKILNVCSEFQGMPVFLQSKNIPLTSKQIDQYHIAVIPVLLGNGIKLFGSNGQKVNLKLIGTKEYNGIIELVYRRR